MAAKFLLCLPLRLGVLIFTFLQFLVCGAAAGLLWWTLYIVRTRQDGRDVWDDLPLQLRIVLIVVGGVYSIAAFVGLLGFLGAICKKNGFLQTYFTLLCAVFGFQLVSSIWYLVSFFRARGQTKEKCLAASTAPNRTAYCDSMEQLKTVPQGWVVVGALIPVFVISYALYVVWHYIKRVNRKKMEKEMRLNKSMPSFVPVQGKEETYPLTQPSMKYPYSDSANAFGANGGPKAPLRV